MASYKLIYFDIKARAEPIRLLFALAGVNYIDCRIKGEDWPKLKPTMPTGTLPVLEINGKRLPQSQAILRYLAREFNLAGSNSFERSQGEAVMETIVDMQHELGPLFNPDIDEPKKADMRRSILEEKIKPKLMIIEDMLSANGGVFFVGNMITVADIALFTSVDFCSVMLSTPDPLKDFPKLATLKHNVGNEPRIAAWLYKRPKSAL